MASAAPVIACMFVGLLILSLSDLTSIHLLPSWLLLSVSKLRGGSHTHDSNSFGEISGPQGVLLHQLQGVDPVRDPKTAYSLHAAIGNILRASGTQGPEALRHFKEARNAAIRLDDSDTLLNARIDVAEAYIEEGRPQDSQHELAVASSLLADHFTEQASRLNRARGLGKFELGFTDSALGYFGTAQQFAIQPEDKVRSASLMAMTHTCLGRASETLQPLQSAMEVLHGVRKAGSNSGMPPVMQKTLAADVHFRLGEAYHAMNNLEFAKAHYTKALHLEQALPVVKAQRVSALKMGITLLKHGSAPDLRCPTLSALPWHAKPQGPPKKTSDAGFMAKIDFLRAEKKLDLVESELKASLSTHQRPYKGLEAATALNMLGKLYSEQKTYTKAAKHFRQALHAAIVCCGAGNDEAQTAFNGLSAVKAELSSHDQKVAAAAMDRYLEVVESGYAGEKAVSLEGSHTPEEDSPVRMIL